MTLATFETLADHYSLDPRIVRNDLHAATPRRQGAKLHVSDHVAIRKVVEGSRPDLIVSFGDVVNVKVLMAAGGSGIPVLVSERTVPSHLRTSRPGLHGWLLVLLRRLMYRRAALLVVQTRAVERWARRGRLTRRVAVIPNVAAAGLSTGIHDQHTILAVGRMSAEKGHDVLLEGFALVAERFPQWRLRIVGDGVCKPALENRVRELSFEGRVEFVLPVSNVSVEYERAGLFVLPSRYEGFPNALIEAMQAGCAVIASDCPSAPREIITEGVDGLLFENGNAAALAQALVQLIPDAARRQTMGTAAQAAAKRYLPEAVLPLWDTAISESVAR